MQRMPEPDAVQGVFGLLADRARGLIRTANGFAQRIGDRVDGWVINELRQRFGPLQNPPERDRRRSAATGAPAITAESKRPATIRKQRPRWILTSRLSAAPPRSRTI